MAKLYRSTDGNAPILCGQRTSLVNVLKACLVDGYGAKPGAGWTMPFISADGRRACFRNNGTGFFLQVDQVSPSYDYQAALNCYEMMTSDSAGSNLIGTTSGLSYSISASAGTTARPWICIATDKYVYFFMYDGVTAMPTVAGILAALSNHAGLNFFFGDFEKAYLDDGFACAFLRSTAATGGRSGLGDCAPTTSSVEGHYIARALSGVVGAIGCSAMMSPPGAMSGCVGSAGPTYDGQTALMVSKVAVNNGVVHTFRGYLPDMLAPCHTRPYENLDTVAIGADTYIAVTWASQRSPATTDIAQALFKIEV